MKGDYDRPPTVSDADNMDDTLYMGELVEPLGFDSIWATEHYGSAYSMQPNHCSTWRIGRAVPPGSDMGTAVIVAPWWNPVRLAHEISMLDILLKGPAPSPGYRPRHSSPRVRLPRLSNGAIA